MTAPTLERDTFSLQTLDIIVAPREHLGYVWLPWSEAAERVFSWSNAEAIRALPQWISTMKPGT